MSNLIEQLQRIKRGSPERAALSAATRSAALREFESRIVTHSANLLAANKVDCEGARKNGLSEGSLQRLTLTAQKLEDIRAGLRCLMEMQDPLGEELLRTELDTGLILSKVQVPLGVIAVIFESRPDVVPQLAGLALRTGNALLLKGGREASHTNTAFAELLQQLPGIPDPWFFLTHEREAVTAFITEPAYVDLVIPRGGNALVKRVVQESTVPVLAHADGVCHLYLDRSADLALALEVIIDAKCQYPAACNALETLLIDRRVAPTFLPLLAARALSEGIVLKGEAEAQALIPGISAVEEDAWHTEYGEKILALKIVGDVNEAIAHINLYGSHHTDGVLAQDAEVITRAQHLIDSSSVMINCSTRFADGFRYGFGAEVGISTSKVHARGPVGIPGLLSYKYILVGSGDIVAPYAKGAKRFTHKKL